MKNLIFKSSFNEKLKMLLIAVGLLVTSLTSPMWGSTTFADGDVLFYDFSDVTGGGGVNWQANGSTMVYDPSGAGTIKCVIFTSSTTWTTSWTIAKTAKGSWANIAFPSDRPSGKNCLKINSAGTSASWTTISLAEKVAKGDLIMVYGGELSSWNQSNYYFIGSNSNTTDNTKALANANKSITINSDAYKFGPVALPSGTYIQGHWASNLSCTIAAGSAYVVRGSGASTTYFTEKTHSGSDYLYQVKKQGATAPTTTLSPTCPSEIDAGTQLSFTPGAAGVSVLGRTNTIKYYLKNGSTYTEKTLSNGKIDVSDLAEGNYSIITLLYDGYIYVKASTSDFSVVTPTTYSLTVDAGSHVGTVTGSTDPVTLGSSYAITASNFDTGYQFKDWTASPAANASFASSTSASTNVTVSNGSVTVTANAKVINYTITYNLDGGTNYAGAPTSYNIETSTITLGTPTKPHYHFDGWTNAGGTAVTKITKGSTGNITLTAHWTKLPMVYLKNTMNWANAYVTFYKSEYWDASNGAGSYNTSPNYAAGPVAMTYNSSTGLFEYECPDVYTYKYACFTKDQQSNYGNFYGTEAIYCNNNLEYEKVAIVARETNTTMNDTKYYTTKTNGNIEFVALASGEGTGWFFPGGWSSWETKGNEGVWNSTNIHWTKTLEANTSYEFKVYNHGVYYGNSGTYSASGSKTFTNGGSNCTLSTTIAGTYTFDYNVSTNLLTISYPAVYAVSGSFNSWTEETNLAFSGNDGTYSVSINGSSTNYEFKVLENAIWYGHSNKTFTTTESNVTLASGSNNIKLKADVYPSGTYTFAYNKSTHKLGVTYPTNYTVTFGKRTGGNTITAKINNTTSFSTGTKIASGTSVTFAQTAATGYTFEGWYNAAEGGTRVSTSSSYTTTISAATTIYANYTPKQCTINFDFDESDPGYGSKTGATTSTTATYAANMTTVTPPTAKNGYAFMGYWDAADGSGTQYYKADGTSKRTWNKNTTSATTLYAYYKKAEITGITFDPGASVEHGETVTVTAAVDPTPAGNTVICWRVLYYDSENPLDPQPAFDPVSASGNPVSFTAPETSAMYKVEATLRTGNACGEGTVIATEKADMTVSGTHTITVNYKCGDDVIKAATTTTARPAVWSDEITAPDIFGYTFARWDAADGVTIKNGDSDPVTTTTNATIQIKATYNGKLTAVYTQRNLIYFKNTLGWSDVYVNFYDEWGYWTTNKGSGNKGKSNCNLAMTRIGETDVWYYDYGAASITPQLPVSFTSESQDNMENFWKVGGVNVVYPDNYPDDINTDKSSENGFKAATPMFVPLATQDGQTLNQSSGGKAVYYNAGYWTKYLPGTGYTLEIYYHNGGFIKSVEFTSADELMPMKAVVDLEGGQTYDYQLRRGGESSAGIYYGNTGTMTYANHGAGTAWEMINTMTGGFQKAGITTNAAGDYTFHLSYSANSGNPPQYRLRMAVDYPVATGDYRVVYYDNVKSYWKPSAIVPKVNNGKDTVSFFIRPGSTPYMKIQQASVNSTTGAITWADYYSVPNGTLTALSGDKVYNACITMDASGGASVAKIEPYTGNYYIRTDCANNKWDNYRSDPDHLMTYSEYSIAHGGYSHYYTHWVKKDDVGRKNVKFTIANDYSPCISDTLARETASGTWANIEHFIEEGGDLKRDANVRFMWNQNTNVISRAYVDGAQGDWSANFLYMLNIEDGDDKIKKGDGTALTDHKITFKDNGNWMYEANIKAQPTAQIKLLSNWGTSNTITQYFRGGESTTETLLGGSGSTWYDIRVIYDFKTNRLIAGLIPSGTIDDQMAIHADVMFIRDHHGDIAQLTFAEKGGKMGSITDIETAFGVLQLNKWTLNNKSRDGGHSPLVPLKSRYERDLFYVSFPFKVSMEEVFGFGTYGQHWIIEEYDGANRAANGYWEESDPNWKFIFNRKNKFFEPGQGYIIALDLDELGESSSVWTNTDQVELYFPSYGTMPNITSSTATYEIPAHLCTINRTVDAQGNPTGLPATYDRRVRDSHWNVLGVPTYVNPDAPNFANTAWTTEASETSIGPNFLYEWNMTDNSVSAVAASTFTYHAMHAYLVQYCGNVTWTSSVSPTAAPRRNPNYRGSYEFRLELMHNDEAVDQTFVKLTDDEAVTTGFEFNYDMSKEMNKNKANIYTLIGTEEAAGNCLPLTDQTTVVPVGVQISTDGEYIFSMPDGTEGIGVTLIDTERGTRTSLSAVDYAVTLDAGTYNERFVIEISPIQQIETGVELINGENGDASLNGEKVTGVCKKLIDGVLYIVKDGKVFDARGARIQ